MNPSSLVLEVEVLEKKERNICLNIKEFNIYHNANIIVLASYDTKSVSSLSGVYTDYHTGELSCRTSALSCPSAAICCTFKCNFYQRRCKALDPL